MKTSEMGLPEHVYTRITSPCGSRIRYIIAPDRLVSWAQEGRGDAIVKLCHSVYERKLSSIDAWEHDRIQQLEKEWMEAGNDEERHARKYVTVKHYHTTREDVAREAERKRASVKKRMSAHQNAIEKLVQEAREFLLAHDALREEDNMLAYLLGIGAVAALAYVLLN